MLVACDVRLWRPLDILSPQDGEWFEVMLPAEHVKRYLAKGFLADNPNPVAIDDVDGDIEIAKPKPRARRKTRAKVPAKPKPKARRGVSPAKGKRTDRARKT